MGRTGPCRAESGSALMLVPASIVVVIVLAAIAVDSAGMFLAHREARYAAAAAANNAAAAGVDVDRFREFDEVLLDERRAVEVATATIEATAIADRIVAQRITVDGTEVEVRLTVQAEPVFAPAVPGSSGAPTIEVVARAEGLNQ